MKKKAKITVPKSCKENWLNLSPTEQGKFCLLCQKNVFADCNDEKENEIIKFLEKSPYLCDEVSKQKLQAYLNKKSS